MRKIIFGSLASLLLLTISSCGAVSFGDNSNGSKDYNVGHNSINSIGGIGGGCSTSKPPSMPSQATDVTVSSLSPSMAVDGTMQFTATTKDAIEEAPRWTSSNPDVATIDNRGLATGTGPGTTQITATADGKTSSPVALTLCDYRHI